MEAFRIERRYGAILKGLVLVILGAFVLADGVAVVAAWREGLTGWFVGTLLIELVLVFALVMFVHRYVVRGVNGHYLQVDEQQLVLGEVDGRSVHQAALADIASIHYDHGNEMSTRVECTDGRAFTLDTLEIFEEEFEELARALKRLAPEIVITRA